MSGLAEDDANAEDRNGGQGEGQGAGRGASPNQQGPARGRGRHRATHDIYRLIYWHFHIFTLHQIAQLLCVNRFILLGRAKIINRAMRLECVPIEIHLLIGTDHLSTSESEHKSTHDTICTC